MTAAAAPYLLTLCILWIGKRACTAIRAARRKPDPFVDWNLVSEYPYNPHFSDRDVAVILDDIAAL